MDDIKAKKAKERYEKWKMYEKKWASNNPEAALNRYENGIARLNKWTAEHPEAARESQKKYKEKLKDLTICNTTEEIAVKIVKIAIAKALTSIANAERYKKRKLLKENYW